MPPDVYSALKPRYTTLLLTLFTHAATPIEAPSKLTYGDIDILVSQPKTVPPATSEFLSAHLGAKRTFKTPGSPTTSLAVPYPDLEDSFVQIDIHECSPQTFTWQLFHQSHGDLWNLLGTTIRPFGLTANDAGLHLRIHEIEEWDRKKSVVLLSREPAEVVQFLGLDSSMYLRPFSGVEEMFAFVKRCRFFRSQRYRREGLRAKDRKRMAQREVYRNFVDEWVPRVCELGKNGDGKDRDGENEMLTRETVLDEALGRFGKKGQYEVQLAGWKKAREELLAKQEGRVKRKAEALELDEYVRAWAGWINCDGAGEAP